jgi:octaprenyl-diphosphate synthase
MELLKKVLWIDDFTSGFVEQNYVLHSESKREANAPHVRFLTAKMVSAGIVNERTYRGACVIELIYTATLVHDDVVDDSNQEEVFSLSMHFGKINCSTCWDYLLKGCCFLSTTVILIYWK